jgi:hypothetical protein
MTSEEEDRIRALRDKVYSHPCSESNWQACREHWTRADSVKWLERHAAIPLPVIDRPRSRQN